MKILKSSILIILILTLLMVFMPKVNAWETASFDIRGLNSNGNAVKNTLVYVSLTDLNNDPNFKSTRFRIS